MGKIRNNQQAHRAGPLKQANKKHKSNKKKNTTEGNRVRTVSVTSSKLSRSSKLKRLERRKQAAVNRAAKIQKTLDVKKAIGGLRGGPIFVGIVPISLNVHVPTVVNLLVEGLANSGTVIGLFGSCLHVRLNSGKNMVFVVSPDKNDLWSVLDMIKLCDLTLFLTPNLEPISPEGLTLLQCIKDQGLPTAFVGVTQNFNKKEEKAYIKKNFRHFPNLEKVFPLVNASQVPQLLRLMAVHKIQLPRGYSLRSSMLIEGFQTLQRVPTIELNTILPGMDVLANPQEFQSLLQVTGIIRRGNLDPSQLVHITGSGNYRVLRVDIEPIKADGSSITSPFDLSIPPRYLYDPKQIKQDEGEEDQSQMDQDDNFSMNSDDLDEFFEGGSEEEEMEVQSGKGGGKGLPKGTSNYQADWLKDSDSEDGEGEGGRGGKDGLLFSDDEIESNKSNADDNEMEDEEEEMDEEEEVEEQRKLARVARDEAEFPDWIDTPMDTPAQVRFQKYRGLQSFKKSPWDPNENLPREYSKIFQFANYRHSYKKIIKGGEDGPGFIPIGQRVRMILKPLDGTIESYPNMISLFSLLKHEDRMSVIHLQLHLSEIVKNKESLFFQVGFRRFQAAPTLSEISPGDKHKMLRIGQPSSTCIATVYAPIVFPNASVLAFRNSRNTLEPVGHGSLFSIDPARIVLKRILLSGYPFKAQGRYAVVRFMFFNREDIEWFKPVELKTRYGRRGHIKEPLGTHGHFKSTFDGQMKSQDTVLMPLYKRVFPKWTFDENVPSFWIYDQGPNDLVKPSKFNI